jgi:hypothetical protein
MIDRQKVNLVNLVGNVLDGQHGDFLRTALSAVLHAVMDAHVDVACGAGYGERSPERANSRNGTRSRELQTRLGTIELDIPKLRQGTYFPPFLTPRRRWEQAFVNVVAEAYVLGVSTRKVEDLVEVMGAKGMSSTEVSRMAGVLDAQVDAFRNRNLEGEFPYVWLDAIYLKVREDGRFVSKSHARGERGPRRGASRGAAAAADARRDGGLLEGVPRRPRPSWAARRAPRHLRRPRRAAQGHPSRAEWDHLATLLRPLPP